MTSLPPLKVRMSCLAEVLNTLFQTLGDNRDQIAEILLKMKELRREHVQYLCKDVPEQMVKRSEDAGASISSKDAISLVQKIIASSHQDQKKSYQFIEDVLWKEFLLEIGKDAMEKKLPEILSLAYRLDKTSEERDALARDKEKLEKSLYEQQQQCSRLKKQVEDMEAKIANLTAENESLKESVKANRDYQYVIRKIRKELEAKRDMDIWRLKVLYNRVAAWTRSEWGYPGVPKPDLFLPKSEEAQKFLESL